jgi:hypothetical protein
MHREMGDVCPEPDREEIKLELAAAKFSWKACFILYPGVPGGKHSEFQGRDPFSQRVAISTPLSSNDDSKQVGRPLVLICGIFVGLGFIVSPRQSSGVSTNRTWSR